MLFLIIDKIYGDCRACLLKNVLNGGWKPAKADYVDILFDFIHQSEGLVLFSIYQTLVVMSDYYIYTLQLDSLPKRFHHQTYQS